MKAKTKREKKLVMKSIHLAYETGKKYGREQIIDNIFLILIGIVFVTLIVFTSIGIDSLIK